MADPNQQGPTSSTAAITSAGKQMKKDQGDFNDILKESINLVGKLSRSYNDIEARLETMNRTSINIKEINKVIDKAATKAFIANKQALIDRGKLETDSQNKVDRYLKGQELIARLEEKYKLARQKGDIIELAAAEKKYEKALSLSENLKNRLSIEEMAAIQSQEANRIAEDAVNIAKKHAKTEKQVEESIGLSGRVMGLLTDKLGFGTEAYEEMVEKARELNKVGKKMSFLDKFNFLVHSIGESIKNNITDPLILIPGIYKAISKAGNMAGAGLSKVGGALGGLTDTNVIHYATSGISSMLKNIPMVGGLLGGVVDMMSSFLDLSIGASSQVQKMGRELGLSKAESLALNNQFSDFATKSGNVLTNSKKLFETQIELGKSLGVMNVLSKERLETDIYLKEVAGLELDTRTSLAESSVILGKNQKDIMNSVFAQVKGLKNATGIQLDQKAVLKEASSLGGYLGLSFAKYPAQLTKSLVSIKAMGMELKQLDSIADSFLDFESSISNEFEAQLLTGKEINLSKAREMFLNNDLAGAAGEITSQVGSASEFLSMNRIQAESMAKAFGMSRDQMGDMLKKQEYMSKIGAKDTDNAQKQYQLALAKYGTQKEMAAALGEETTQNMMNASAQEKIAGFMDKIKQSFVDLISNSGITKFIDKAIEWVSKPENIEAIVNKIQGFFHTVLQVTGSVIGGIMKFLDFLPGISIDSELIDTVSNLGDSFTSSPVGSLSGTKIASEKAATGRSAAAASAGGSQVVANVNMKTEYKPDPNNPAKMMYRIINEDTGQKSDWQTNVFGK